MRFRAAVSLLFLLAGCGARSTLQELDAQGGTTAGSGTGGGGAGGTGGSAGSGADGGAGGSEPVCSPGDEVVCYGGPAGTPGVGTCSSGYSQCNADGSGFGPCQGEVVPAPEDCQTPEDEDCDGVTLPCGAEWVRSFGPDAFPIGLSADDAGGVVVLGGLTGTATFGPGLTLSTNGTADLFVLRMSAGGEVLWVQQLPGAGVAVSAIGSVGFDGAGNIVIAGGADDAVDFGAGPVAGNGGFVAELTPSGQLVWADRVEDSWVKATVAPSGEVVSIGWQLCIDAFVCGDLVHLTKHGSAGEVAWTEEYIQSTWFHPLAISTDAAGDVYFTGDLIGSLDLDGVALSAPEGGVVVAKAGGDGAVKWAKVFVDQSGVSGLQLTYPMFFGSSGTVAAYAGTLGATGQALGVAPDGDVVIAGTMLGSLALGGPLLEGASSALFLARLDPAGNHVWSRTTGGPVYSTPPAVAVTPSGEVLAAATMLPLRGYPPGYLDFGGGPLPPGLALARLAPEGEHVSSSGHATDGYVNSWLLIDDEPGGGMFVSARFEGEITLANETASGMVVARVAP